MRGHLVIADISGYTRFLTESELEHANGILAELLNSVIAAIHAPLEISNLEGDAVFLYGVPPEGMTGQTVVESVEVLYAAFAGSLETMIINTTCSCNACANIKSLGLKIVMHCGEFAVSTVGGKETLNGADVIVAHRLLKNHVIETTGIDDYMLVTQDCVDALGIADIVAGWTPHTEEYEHVGEVNGYVSSLRDVWRFLREQNEDKVLQKDAWLSLVANTTAPPAVVWDHMIDPFKRSVWLSAHNDVTNQVDGRIAAGVDFHCAHGDGIVVFSVLDMKPMDYMTYVFSPIEGIGMRYTDYLVPSGSGTRVITYGAPPYVVETGEQVDQGTLDPLIGPVSEDYQKKLDDLVAMTNAAWNEVAIAG